MSIFNLANRIKRTWSSAPSVASTELLDLYHRNPRLDGARIIATKCASVDLFIYKKMDKLRESPLETHELYDLLDNPCPIYPELNNSWSLKYFIYACYTLVGNAYILKVRDGKKIVGLMPIAPSWVIKVPTENDGYWHIYPLGESASEPIVVPKEDVIWFKDIDLNDPYGRGKGTAQCIGDVVQTSEYAEKYSKNLFFNDATPSTVIVAPSVSSQEGVDKIKQSWMSKMAGFRHAHEPMVLTGDGSDIKTLGTSPKELDFVNSQAYLRDVSDQQFHIPPEIRGILENSNRSTIDSAFYLLNKNVLSDYLRMFERVINTQLLWIDFDKTRTLLVHHENTVEEDINQKLQIVNAGLNQGAITRNEWRTAMGFERDEHAGDVYLTNYSTIERKQDSEEVVLPDTPSNDITLPDEDNDQLSERAYSALVKNIEKMYHVVKADDKEEVRRTTMWKSFDARARAIETPFIKASKKVFKAQLDDILALVTDKKDMGTVIENYFTNDVDIKTKRTLASAFLNGLEEGAKLGSENLGKKSMSKSLGDVFNLWIDNYGLILAKNINATTKLKLRQAIADEIEEGDGIPKIKKVIKDTVEGMSDYRATLIARTESCTTMNAGSNALYKSENIQQKMWIAVRDNRTRDAHSAMDGVVVPIDSKFDLPATEYTDAESLEYAGDPSASAGNVCNCRCTVAPFVEF